MQLYDYGFWEYNGEENTARKIKRTFDEKCSTIYLISYILKPEVNTMNNENRTPHWIPYQMEMSVSELRKDSFSKQPPAPHG